ncbi:MAG: TldD/PmbA family protein [Defluviitaleaceae bacterium]|nr:TldD/PmbA family protein [Defluviitaleaceae bacterium]MCL2273349.1 TldD/PmbA family protein [Defluviitaleaceae bacterium]
MTFDTFKTEIFAQAKTKGFTDCELFHSGSTSFSVRVLNGEISEYKNTSLEGVGFRGTFNGKMGYAYTEKMAPELINPLLDNAAANAGIIEEEEVEKLYKGDESYPTVNSYNEALNNIDAAQKIEWALEMEKYAKSLDPRVKMADYCTVANSEGAMSIANSHGLDLAQKQNMAMAYIIARVEENGVTKSGYEYWNGRDFADFCYKTLAEKAVKKALSYLGASSMESGDLPVVFDNSSTKDLFGVFSGVFMAENGQKGFSMLNKDRLGEVVAAPHIVLRDDGVCDKSLGSMAFDAEGVATQQKAVIENGVLKTLLYNLKSAAKDGVKSTGNASKAGFGGAIGTSVNNLYLQPSETSFQDLIKPVEKGVLITEMAGLHSGANAVSGDFSFSADGFLIENGAITRPIEQITVAGNFYELLKNIETVGSDLRFHSMGTGGMGMPSVLVNGLRISGM